VNRGGEYVQVWTIENVPTNCGAAVATNSTISPAVVDEIQSQSFG